MEKHIKIFKKDKPIIGCLHLRALPGTPKWNKEYTLEQHIEDLRNEAKILMELGYDAVVFANESDYPYLEHVGPEIVAAYARIVTEVKRELTVPFGVGVLFDPYATVALAMATGASFVRGFFTNTCVTDFGIINRVTGEIFRYAKHIGAGDLSIYTAIEGHYGEILDKRPVEEKFRSVAFIVPVAGYIMSGPISGVAPDASTLAKLKEIDPSIPLILNSGASPENIKSLLPYCDGVIVGTSLKKDRYLFNPIDYENAKAFIQAAKGA